MMMIFLPLSMNLRRSPECSAWPTVAPTCANCLIVSRICLSRMRRSVTTMTESKTGASSFVRPMSWCASQAIEFDFAAAGRMLNQVPLAGAVLAGIGEQPAHHVELVVAREDLLALLLAGLRRLSSRRPGRSSRGCRSGPRGVRISLPQVVGLEAVRVRRVAGAVVPALVERQEPRALALQVRAEPHLVVVHGEMDDAAAELEQHLARVAVALVLLDRILDRLLGQAVLQLEGGDRQAVDEEPEIERALGLVAAVAELPRDAEAVLRECARRPSGCRARACRRTASTSCGPCLTPSRSTSITPRLLISPCSRARNFRRGGPSSDEVQAIDRFWLGRRRGRPGVGPDRPCTPGRNRSDRRRIQPLPPTAGGRFALDICWSRGRIADAGPSSRCRSALEAWLRWCRSSCVCGLDLTCLPWSSSASTTKWVRRARMSAIVTTAPQVLRPRSVFHNRSARISADASGRNSTLPCASAFASVDRSPSEFGSRSDGRSLDCRPAGRARGLQRHSSQVVAVCFPGVRQRAPRKELTS